MNIKVRKEFKFVKMLNKLVASKKFGMKKSNIYPMKIIPGKTKDPKYIIENEKRYQ